MSTSGELPPVLLVHGIKDDERRMARLGRHLREAGRTVYAMTLVPNWAQIPLEQYGEQLAAYVARTLPGEARFDLVGFSMGGLVSRYYVQRLGGLERTRRFVTISTPHRGTWTAYLLPFAGVRQMRPGSAFLRDLDTDGERLKEVRFTSFWTPLDLMILPSQSSITPHSVNERMWCSFHHMMVAKRDCLCAVERVLGAD